MIAIYAITRQKATSSKHKVTIVAVVAALLGGGRFVNIINNNTFLESLKKIYNHPTQHTHTLFYSISDKASLYKQQQQPF